MRKVVANMLAVLLSTVTVTTLFYLLLLSPYFSMTTISKPISTTAVANHNATIALTIGTTTNTGDFTLMSRCYSFSNVKVIPWIDGYSSISEFTWLRYMLIIDHYVIIYLIASCLLLLLLSIDTLPTSIGSVHRSEVVGFWNIYADGPYYKDIIEEQHRVLYSSGLMVRIMICMCVCLHVCMYVCMHAL